MEKIKSIIKQPTTWLGTGFVTQALEAWANGNDTQQTWMMLAFGIVGILKNEAGAKK